MTGQTCTDSWTLEAVVLEELLPVLFGWLAQPVPSPSEVLFQCPGLGTGGFLWSMASGDQWSHRESDRPFPRCHADQ